MSNLLLLGSGYHFRKIIPQDVRSKLGKTEIRVSLRTHSKKEAKAKASYLLLVVDSSIFHARKAEAKPDSLAIQQEFKERLTSELDKLRLLSYEPKVPNLYQMAVVNADGKPIENVTQNTKKEVKGGAVSVGKLKKLSVFFKDYTTHKVNTGEWKEGRVKEYTQAIELLLEVLPDKAVDLYSREEARHYRDTMLKLPTNRKKRKPYRNKSVKQLLRMNIPDADILAGKTINGQLSKISGFFKWVKDEYEDDLEINVFEGLSVSEKDSISYKPFTKSELKQLFNSDAYQSATKPSKYWLPLLGLYTGGRIEEICQLTVDDIKASDDGIRYFLIHDEGDNELKNDNSYRKVPVHKELVNLGFFEYLEVIKLSGHKMLLPDLVKMNGKWSARASKVFSQMAREVGVKSDRSKCFHSFRKNTVDALALVTQKDSMVSQIVGHSQQGMTFGRYFSEYPLEQVKETIDLIEYDIPLEELNGLWRSVMT